MARTTLDELETANAEAEKADPDRKAAAARNLHLVVQPHSQVTHEDLAM
jgi:hypothetical protein